MTEPSRAAPDTDNTETDPEGQLDPTLARPAGEPVLPTRRMAPEPDFAPPMKPGEVGTLGRYRVLKKLGQGGMGAVYLAHDTVLARRIALKVMLPHHAADPEARERFLREARTAAMVRSDHVVTIFDVGEERGAPFIAMEYLLGHPLDQYLRANGELPVAQVFRIGTETALGLAAAHELGLVHRDIKPGNIWLEAPHGRVKLLDFGLARAENDDTHLTTSGLVIGTPAFMSPEQARGLKLDGRSDLFSLGVMLYRLTTGKMPFSGTTTMAVLTSLAVDTPAPVRQLNADVPDALQVVIAKLLSKNPADRYQSAQEVVTALREAEQPRPVEGGVPVAVPVAPMAIEAQSENVWEGIESTASGPVLLESGTEHMPVSSAVRTRGERKKPERTSSKLPVVLAAGALVAGMVLLAAVLLWPSKGLLLVESDDPDAELVIKLDGEMIRDRTRTARSN
jgi:serine/threonine protein kinase